MVCGYPEKECCGMDDIKKEILMLSGNHTPIYDQSSFLGYLSPENNSSANSLSCVALPTSTRRTRRTVYTSHQLLELEKQYTESKFLTRIVRIKLASSLNLSEKTIKIWFQNRRMKDKSAAERNSSLASANGIPEDAAQTHSSPEYINGFLKSESYPDRNDCIQSFDHSHFIGVGSSQATFNAFPEHNTLSPIKYSQFSQSDIPKQPSSATLSSQVIKYEISSDNQIGQPDYSTVNQVHYQSTECGSYHMPCSPVSSFESFHSCDARSPAGASFYDNIMSVSNYIQENPDLVEEIRMNDNKDFENMTIRQLMELFQLC
ncbi:unnamed protein product [Phaedon cochleariae]|uniref:Homeobox domain-containing protein n=1 Tax=Phaedon cochleariae TaxID=80249 RepID=A0A9N9X1D8_PHACE|nr:unnamed protein product [Phaedon cochleariae]